MAKRRQVTWGEVAVANAGFRDGMRALQFVLDWGMATAWLGHEPESIEEFAEVAKVSRASAFRSQKAFRKAFPEVSGPDVMIARTGGQKQYDDLINQLRDITKARKEAAGLVFSLGATVAPSPL